MHLIHFHTIFSLIYHSFPAHSSDIDDLLDGSHAAECLKLAVLTDAWNGKAALFVLGDDAGVNELLD